MKGAIVQHYELLEKLGAGGMGEVFKAHDKRLNRFVAIKVLPLARSGSPERRRRFIQEAQSASGLNHPNIITVHDILDEGDTQYLVMEYVVGKTLHEMIPPDGLRVSKTLHYAVQMADALNAAHTAGIVHRDFKPANVMVTKQGFIKVLDFGLAKVTEPTPSTGGGSGETAAVDLATLFQAPITTEGAVLGTVSYMSPEQAEGRRVDARSDIFAFGAVLYEMVTGKRAFRGTSDLSTLTAVLRDPVTPIPEIAPDVPHEFEEIVSLCLQKSPDARYQSMDEVSMALNALKRRSDAGALRRPGSPASSGQHDLEAPRSVLNTNAPSATRTSAQVPAVAGETRKSRTPLLAALTAVLLIGAGLGGAWWWTSHHGSAPASNSVSPAPAAPAPAAQTTAVPASPAMETTPPAVEQEKSKLAPAAPTPNRPPKREIASKPAPIAASPAPASPAPHAETPAPVAEAPRVVKEATALSVSDGLPFTIALDEDVPADASEGQPLTFRVAKDVKINDVVVITRGASVAGSVVGERGKKRFLRTGTKMTFQLDSVEAIDGQRLKVRALAARRPDGQAIRPIDTGKYAKSKDVAAPRGSDYTAYVDGDQSIAIRH